MRMIKKSTLSGHPDVPMSRKEHSQYEHPSEKMAKLIDGREILDVMDDNLIH